MTRQEAGRLGGHASIAARRSAGLPAWPRPPAELGRLAGIASGAARRSRRPPRPPRPKRARRPDWLKPLAVLDPAEVDLYLSRFT